MNFTSYQADHPNWPEYHWWYENHWWWWWRSRVVEKDGYHHDWNSVGNIHLGLDNEYCLLQGKTFITTPQLTFTQVLVKQNLIIHFVIIINLICIFFQLHPSAVDFEKTRWRNKMSVGFLGSWREFAKKTAETN